MTHVANKQVPAVSAYDSARIIESSFSCRYRNAIIHHRSTTRYDIGETPSHTAHQEIAIRNEDVAVGMHPHGLRLDQGRRFRRQIIEYCVPSDGIDEKRRCL